MQEIDQFRLNQYPVDAVIEVRLSMDTWEKIRRIAIVRSSSYSWAVRYCLFRLVKRKNPIEYIRYAGNPKYDYNFSNFLNFKELNKNAWEKRVNTGNMHRCRICFYGQDELFIRLAAARLQCTMSHLIRLALEKYLDTLIANIVLPKKGIKGWFKRSFWFWLGVKVHCDVEFPFKSITKIYFDFIRYQPFEYFNYDS